MSIQDLVGGLIDEFLERETRAVPYLANIINDLRENKDHLNGLGISHLDLFGSITRGDAGRGSDIDIAVEFKDKREMSLSKFAALKINISEILNWDIDPAERQKLLPEIRRAFDRDAIKVF
ncbi:MAG: nucleotidyltransferase domain-containing protein [Rhodospirillales bacterium]